MIGIDTLLMNDYIPRALGCASTLRPPIDPASPDAGRVKGLRRCGKETCLFIPLKHSGHIFRAAEKRLVDSLS